MNPGRLDRLAQFYALTEPTGPAGAPRRTFANPVAIWVGIDKRAGKLPDDQSGGRRAVVDTTFTARFSESITAGSRLRVDGQTYEITSAVEAPGPRRAYLTLTCRAIPGALPVAP